MRRFVAQIGLIAVSCLLGVNSWAVAPDLRGCDWSANAGQSLAAHPPSDDVIAAFVAKLEGIEKVERRLSVCFARFADLRHSGNLSLVVSTSDGRFCDSSIFDKSDSKFEWYGFDGESEAVAVQDIAGDGNLEVVTETDFTSYQGTSHCVANWPVVYAWTGNSYNDVSYRYRAYYQRELASLKKEIAASNARKQGERQQSVVQAEQPSAVATNAVAAMQQSAGLSAGSYDAGSAPATQESEEQGSDGSLSGTSGRVVFPDHSPPTDGPPAPDKLGLDCTKAEAAKIERFLGISRDAGMSDAILWADSDDPDTRIFAAGILADIGTAEAISYLKTLSHDPNQEVDIAAKSGLVVVGRGPVVHTVDHEPISEDAHKSGE